MSAEDHAHHDHDHDHAHGHAHAPPQPDDKVHSYYQILGVALKELLIEKGVVSADEVRRPQLSVAQKRQGNRFAQVQIFPAADAKPAPRVAVRAPPAAAAPDLRELKRALPAGRNFH